MTTGWRAPMLAQLQSLDDHVRDQAGGHWIYERKLDGLRGVAVRHGSQVTLWSRNHLSFTGRFPAICAALGVLAADDFVIDGELVAFDGDQTSFTLLQRPGAKSRPVFCVFDVISLLGRDTTGLGVSARKDLLRQLLAGAPDVIRIVETLAGEPGELMSRACADGWEGLIAKRATSRYVSGRSRDWRKLKCSASQELVIGGWTDPQGRRTGFGALLVGHYEGARLRYAGKVGTGFDEATLGWLHGELVRRERPDSPFADPVGEKGPHWARPELVANIGFGEWTADGKLRHPRFLGVRPDKDPATVRRESPPGKP